MLAVHKPDWLSEPRGRDVLGAMDQVAYATAHGVDVAALAKFYGFDEDAADGSPSPVPAESVDTRSAAPDAAVRT